MYGTTSMKAVHSPKRSAYCSAPSTSPVTPRMYIPTPALVPMTVERIAWPLRYPHSALSIRCVSGAPAVRREARVDRALEPLHVEEHVDRDDDDQDHREQEQHDRERRALRERDRVLRIAGDLAGAEPVDPVVHLLADLDPARARGRRATPGGGRCRARRRSARRRRSSVTYSSTRSAALARLVEGDGADRDEERHDDGEEDACRR